MTISLTDVLPEQTAAVNELLREADLLTDDLPEGLPNFILAFDDDKPIGVAGVEVYGKAGLLRSVAVAPAYRSQRVGGELVRQLQQRATQQGVEDLYLITTTADAYFARKGFCRVDRGEVPAAIVVTQQFSTLCPSSAVVMKKRLKDMVLR